MPFSYTTNEPVNEEISQIEIIDFAVDLVRNEIHYTVELQDTNSAALREVIYTVTPDYFASVLADVETYNASDTVYNSIKNALYDDYARQTGKVGTIV